METWLLILLLMSCLEGAPVPPLPTPHLPVYRGGPVLEDQEESDLPQFLPVSRLVTVVEGGTAFLQCSLTGLSSHHLVSWLRLPDMSVLTVGGLVFSSDPRLAVTVSPEGRIWQLEISNVSLADEGDYQCQVNTHSRLSSIHNLQVIERPRANPRSSTEYSLNEAAIPDIEEDHHAKADIVILKENPVDIKQNPSSSTVSPPSPSTTTATTSTSSTRLPKLSSQSYRVPQEISSTNILLVLMSAFSLVVFAIMTAGCSLGLYRKYKYPELSGSRPASRTGTLDSRGSSGSSGSRRSRRQSRRERDDEIYSEVRVKSEEDDIRTRPGSVISDPPLISPTQQRQRVSFSSFQTSRDRRLTVSLASTESLSLTSGQDDSLKPHGKKIRFNPYDEFSD